MPASRSGESLSSWWLRFDALQRRPRTRFVQLSPSGSAHEVIGVSAVDHVIGGACSGGLIHLGDRFREALACWQTAVVSVVNGWRPACPLHRSARDADSLVGVRHGDGRHHVGLGLGKGADLVRVIALGLLGGHHLPGVVAITPRPNTAAHHHWELRNTVLRLQIPHERDGVPVHCRDVVAGVAEERAPIGARSPGRALEDEARSISAGYGDVPLEIADEAARPSCVFIRSKAAK